MAPDGPWLASGSQDKTVRIWDVATGRDQPALLEGHNNTVEAVAVAPDGSWLASGDSHGVLRIWDAAAGQVRALMRVDSSVTVAAWLDYDSLVVGGSAGLYLFGFLTCTS